MLRDDAPLAWMYHRNTARWPHNVLTPGDETPDPGAEHLDAPYVTLPTAQRLDMPFEELLERRASCRNYGAKALPVDQLATILWVGYGRRGVLPGGSIHIYERTVPSAGAMYPLEIYVLARRVTGLPPGVHHYAIATHGLELLSDTPLSARFLADIFMGQPYATNAATVVVLTAVLGRTTKKYLDRGYRYALLEAGHVCQNMTLAAAALGLGCLSLGGFFDDMLAGLLGTLAEEEPPLYALALGPSQTEDPAAMRGIGPT